MLLLLSLLCSAWAEPNLSAVEIARQEWKFFGGQLKNADGTFEVIGHREDEDVYSGRVHTYWKEGTGEKATGKDRHYAWSAAFMSYIMKKSGLVPSFEYSVWHATYIRQAIRARREQDESAPFWAYRLSERAPRVGDLVGYARQPDIDFDRQKEVYKSHTDIVVAVRPGEIDVIGGNVTDSVTLKRLATDSKGLLIDKNYSWFVVMAARDGEH